MSNKVAEEAKAAKRAIVKAEAAAESEDGTRERDQPKGRGHRDHVIKNILTSNTIESAPHLMRTHCSENLIPSAINKAMIHRAAGPTTKSPRTYPMRQLEKHANAEPATASYPKVKNRVEHSSERLIDKQTIVRNWESTPTPCSHSGETKLNAQLTIPKREIAAHDLLFKKQESDNSLYQFLVRNRQSYTDFVLTSRGKTVGYRTDFFPGGKFQSEFPL